MAKRYSQEVIDLCKQFFVKGWTVSEISKEMNVDERTLYNWRSKNKWEDHLPADSIEITIAKRINLLAERENKSSEEISELASLCETFGNLKLKLAEAKSIQVGYNNVLTHPPSAEQDQVPSEGKPSKKKKRKKKAGKNDISNVTDDMLDDVRGMFFDYQQRWYEVKNDPELNRTRFILKSRQIGATFYFAFEALDDAIRTGDNQIFLSASRDQAEVFKAYIIAFASEHFDVELKGQGVIKLSNGAELRFLSTNSRTAQSYHGHLYVDEVFWIPNFDKIWKVASGMAAHKKWRRTLFSTPSAMSHEAYPMWAGGKYNKNRTEKNQVDFDLSHKALRGGQFGADKIWRHIVTVKDAEKQGCDLFDIEGLKIDYGKDDFANLFMCKFIDDAKSIFSLSILMTCMSEIDWQDYNPNAPRPFGNRPVALGYDPSRTRDNATLSILAIPLTPDQPWRVLATIDYHGQNFQYQANRIKDIVDTHNVVHIGIDITGLGMGVFELVEQFYPLATPIHYSNETKTQLVMKAIDVIENGRFKYQAGDKNITQSFMMITKTTTPSGMITYASGRNSEVGHADKAWSIMHALNQEELAPRQKTTVVFG